MAVETNGIRTNESHETCQAKALRFLGHSVYKMGTVFRISPFTPLTDTLQTPPPSSSRDKQQRAGLVEFIGTRRVAANRIESALN